MTWLLGHLRRVRGDEAGAGYSFLKIGSDEHWCQGLECRHLQDKSTGRAGPTHVSALSTHTLNPV